MRRVNPIRAAKETHKGPTQGVDIEKVQIWSAFESFSEEHPFSVPRGFDKTSKPKTPHPIVTHSETLLSIKNPMSSNIDRQAKTFVNFINATLSKKYGSKYSIEKVTDLSDGVALILVVEVLSSWVMKGKSIRPKNIFAELENVKGLIDYMTQEKKIPMVNINANNIVEHKNEKIILALVWQIILNFKVVGTSKDGKHMSESDAAKEFFSWTADLLQEDGKDDVKITNLTTQWQDGHLLKNLLCKLHVRDQVEKEVTATEPVELNNECILYAEKNMNIPQIVSGDDIASGPDKMSMMTYLSYFRDYDDKREILKVAERKKEISSLKEDLRKNDDENMVLKKQLENANKKITYLTEAQKQNEKLILDLQDLLKKTIGEVERQEKIQNLQKQLEKQKVETEEKLKKAKSVIEEQQNIINDLVQKLSTVKKDYEKQRGIAKVGIEGETLEQPKRTSHTKRLYTSEELKTMPIKETNWQSIVNGDTGLKVFRIADSTKEKIEKVTENVGTFQNDSCYIVLNTNPEGKHKLHVWVGSNTDGKDHYLANVKVHELEGELGPKKSGKIVYEKNGFESRRFRSYFDKFFVLTNDFATNTESTRLLWVKGYNTNLRVTEVKCHASSLNHGDVFILATDERVYLWNGKASSNSEKKAGVEVAQHLNDQRGCKDVVTVIEDGKETDEFFSLLGGNQKLIKSARAGGSDLETQIVSKRLWKLSDKHGDVEFTLVAEKDFIPRELLDSRDVFILDVGYEIWVWIGNFASQFQRSSCLNYAQVYLKDFGRKPVPINRIIEYEEPIFFLKNFASWGA